MSAESWICLARALTDVSGGLAVCVKAELRESEAATRRRKINFRRVIGYGPRGLGPPQLRRAREGLYRQGTTVESAIRAKRPAPGSRRVRATDRYRSRFSDGGSLRSGPSFPNKAG